MTPFIKRWIGCFALGFALVIQPGAAQDSPQEGYDSEAGVPARIRALEGDATLERDRERDRLDATINAPVYPGDRIISYAPLEIQLPDGSLVWCDSDTVLEVVALSDTSSSEGTVLKVTDGTIETRIETAASGESAMRFDTPESSVYLMSRGRFRIESTHGVTTVTSYRGVAELAGDEGSTIIRSGQQSRVQTGTGAEDAWAVNTLRLDNFGEWCEERESSYLTDSEDQEEREYVAQVPRPVRHYVSELDYYGDWQFVATYGWVWRPAAIQVGWRPYYSGYWCWRPGGWTWVSYEPWGWLPYHYGRWSWVTSAGWVWIPGAVYSGAWVSWAVTPTYVGWCPLDYYNRPAYVRSNYTNVTVNHYGGGWNFLPLNRWGERSLSRDIVRADRVPQLQGAVTTRSLPRFDSRQAKLRPEIVQHIVRETPPRRDMSLESAQPGSPQSGGTSFRQSDRRERTLSRQPEARSFKPDNTGSTRSYKPDNAGKQPPRAGVSTRGPAGAPDNNRSPRSVETFKPRRIAPPVGPAPTTSQEGPREPRNVPPPRVRSISDDPSRRVLDKILRDGAGQPQEARAIPQGPDRGRSGVPLGADGRRSTGGETTRKPIQGQGGRHAEGKPAGSPQSRREAPPPGKKQDESRKKDKP
jgi:hypothetical protein